MGDSLISLKKVVQVLIPYIAAYANNSCLSVQHDSNTIPNYSISKIHSPFCLYATRERQIGATCRIFYNSLQEGFAKQICPFGFDVLYSKTKIGGNHIIIYGILSFDDSIFSKSILDYPRATKKKSKSEITKFEPNFDPDETYSFFISVTDILNTLLAGRVGASIRSLSHHLLTPLQGAISDAGNIEENINTTDDLVRLKKNLSSINETAKRIQILLAEQLEFKSNKVRRVAIHTYISDITSQLESVANKKRILFKNGFNNVSLTIEAIPDQIYILLQNLIHNALKYSHKGFENKHNKIETSYSSSKDNNLVINISNIGCGITKEEIESNELFELGFRGTLSDDRGRSGSGCGLYISNLIATAHKGKILVSSEPFGQKSAAGQAYLTKFSLVLPILQKD